jgi:hypothetical protein
MKVPGFCFSQHSIFTDLSRYAGLIWPVLYAGNKVTRKKTSFRNIFFSLNLFLIIAFKYLCKLLRKLSLLQVYKKKPEMALKYILTVSTIERFKIFSYTNFFRVYVAKLFKKILETVAAPCPA